MADLPCFQSVSWPAAQGISKADHYDDFDSDLDDNDDDDDNDDNDDNDEDNDDDDNDNLSWPSSDGPRAK